MAAIWIPKRLVEVSLVNTAAASASALFPIAKLSMKAEFLLLPVKFWSPAAAL